MKMGAVIWVLSFKYFDDNHVFYNQKGDSIDKDLCLCARQNSIFCQITKHLPTHTKFTFQLLEYTTINIKEKFQLFGHLPELYSKFLYLYLIK